MDDAVTDFKQWYKKQPAFTRTYLTISFALTVLSSLHLLSIAYLYYDFYLTFPGIQLWRPFTAIAFQGNFNFMFIFSMYFSFFALSRVQTDLFTNANYHDFLWLTLYLFFGLTFLGAFFPVYFTADGFIFAMLYIWCKRRPFETITLLFGLKCKSGYVPWVLLFFRLLMGGIWGQLTGLLLGHLYITVKDLFVPKYHKDYLATPQFFKKLVRRFRGEVERARNPGPANVPGPFEGRGVMIG